MSSTPWGLTGGRPEEWLNSWWIGRGNISGQGGGRHLPGAFSSSGLAVPFPQEFEQDALAFQQRVEDIDRRLGTVFTQAFNDAPDLEHIFKVCPSPPFSLGECHRGARQCWSCRHVGLDSGTVTPWGWAWLVMLRAVGPS